ncbi:uncharacterized protein zfhx2 isoform X1 [Alosa pseudoharengus]|uniref:uncharacterized protein zfhx2 isoform X1 n=2 Tax=Alosa pseudoharengus TaxID=34774 RepID=UPI003F896450
MQEEAGETISSDSNGVSMWLCPLCQQGQPDRDGLSLHLTGKHSVLPACLDKLLDIAVQTHSSGEDAKARVQTGAADACLEPTLDEEYSKKIADGSQMSAGDKDAATLEKDMDDEVEGMQDPEADVGGLESDQESAAQSSKASRGAVGNDKSMGKNEAGTESNSNRPFKCNACLESFPTKTALSVHYNSTTHIQRMRTGSSKQAGENDASGPYPSRPYVSNKPYQCAVCRVSYNHAITLESHLKSVLHQTRSRNANNSANKTASSSSSSSSNNNSSSSIVPNLVVATTGNATQLVNTTTSNCITQPSLTASAATTKDGEQIQPAPSLLTSPVASAQAVSAFLTLLTSSPNSIPHSILPSLFATGAGATPGTAAGPQLVPQAQVLMPLILNGLQTQNPQSPSPELSQSLPVLGLSAAQQALLAQRLSGLQSQWSSVGLQASVQPDAEDSEGAEKTSGLQRPCEQIKIEPKEESLPLKLDIKCEVKSERVVESEGLKKECKEEEQGKVSATELSSALKTEDNRVEDGVEHMEKGQESDTDEESTMERESAESDTKKLPCTNVTNSLAAPSQSLLSDGTLSDLEQAQCYTPKHRQTVNSTEIKSRPLNASLALGRSGLGCSRSRPPFSPGAPVLSEFQYQVLLAFLESRSEADAASPPREDCEALGREVGLTEEEVRKWLEDAHQAKERQKAGELRKTDGRDYDQDDDEESALTIDESPVRSAAHAIDLSSGGDRRREKERESQGDSCLTSDSENEEVYTSVIVTDEESQGSSMREEPSSPAKEAPQREQVGEKSSGGGKVLRSTTVFLSDAEDDDEEEEGGSHVGKRKRRKRDPDGEDVEAKRDRPDPDLDLELEAQADPPTPLSVSIDQRGLPSSILHSLPLSLSLAPFSTQLFSPYVLSLPSSVVGVGVAEGDGGKVAAFPNAQTIAHCSAAFSEALNSHSLSSHSQHAQYMSNGGDCETALDLSMGKNHSSTKASTSVSVADKTAAQKGRLLDGLGLRPAAVGVPSEGGLIVLQVKPDSAIAIPAANNSNFINHNNLAKTNTVLMRAAEREPSSTIDREKDKEREKEKEQRRPKARRFKDMRRSRTIIQAEQLDVLYGCYFKDPNPGKHEFEQISEWVHLPKKVVQIWFQNMRARERKGEVRFISDGTLAAVGKPLIKFTWPLTQPIFSSSPKNSTNSNSTAGATSVNVHPKAIPGKEDKVSVNQGANRPKEGASASAVTSGGGTLVVPKTKTDSQTPVTMVKIAPKAIHPAIQMSAKDSTPTSSSPSQKPNPEEEHDNPEQGAETDRDSPGPRPGAANRAAAPKSSTAPASTGSEKAIGESQQHNGLNYWTPKSPFKINTLSREQLGLSTFCTRNLNPTTSRNPTPTPAPRNPTTTTPQRNPPSTPARIPPSNTAIVTSTSTPTVAKSSQRDVGFLTHSTPRRPRTHLTCLQLSILQSCYETCAHPNALECEAVGTELGLPLKVVQIWFQNTRAKEKRWRLQQEKLSPSSDPSKKVEISAASYLQYNALRANRPILPKPVQLTVVEPSQPPGVGQPAGRETLRGRCEACNATFESRAAARAHVFSPRHLATLRTTNFGQPAALLNNGSSTGGAGSNASVAAVSSTPSPASSTTS